MRALHHHIGTGLGQRYRLSKSKRDMSAGQHGHVVETVTHHGHTPTQSLQSLDAVELFLRFAFGNEIAFWDVQALGNSGARSSPVISGVSTEPIGPGYTQP